MKTNPHIDMAKDQISNLSRRDGDIRASKAILDQALNQFCVEVSKSLKYEPVKSYLEYIQSLIGEKK